MTEPFQMITSPDSLGQVVKRLRNEASLALDTEFVWDRTYFARLGLVQIGLADGTCFLIDAVALADLAPLGELLADERITKILHDAPQDLMILRRATGVPARRIFDTRLAAGFAGLPATLSLGNLLTELLDVHLAKAHTRADWLARPLAPEVLEYAVDDVRFLPELAGRIRERTRAAGVEAWRDDELAALDDPALYGEKPPAEAWLRFRAAASLAPRQLAVLREVAGWREEEARRSDRPRRWILEDGVLVNLATMQPRTPEELARVRDLNSKTARRSGADLLAAVQRGLALPEAGLPPPVFQPGRSKTFQHTLSAAQREIRTRAESRGIDPALVCNRTELARLLADGAPARPEDHRLLRGWRAELLGDLLAKYLPQSLF